MKNFEEPDNCDPVLLCTSTRAVNSVGMKKGRFVWPEAFTGMQWGDRFFGPFRGV